MNRHPCLALVLLVAAAAASAAQTAPVLFRTPVLLSTIVNSPFMDYSPTPTGDNLTLYFTSNRPGGLGSRDVWMTTRPDLVSPWSPPVPVPALNSVASEDLIDVQNDDLEFFMVSGRTGGLGGLDLWWSSRLSPAAPWGTPVPLTTLNTARTEWDPALTADGLELYFVGQQRPEGGQGQYSIYGVTRSAKRSSLWSRVTYIKSLDSPFGDHSPGFAPDGLTLLWSSTRTGGTGSSDFYRAVRPDRSSSTWTVLGEQQELNTTGWEHNGQFSGDGFSFYYTANASNQLWVAHRILPLTLVDGVQPFGPGVYSLRVGQSLTVHCRRDPGDIGIIAAATRSIPPTPLPPLQGNLELDVSAMFLIPLLTPGTVGTIGNLGRYTFPVPLTAPNAVGARAHFQVAAQDPTNQIYLGNRVEVVIIP